MLVRAELKNTEKLLLPGMYASVAVSVGEPRQVVTVPRTSISYSLYGDTIFVLKPTEVDQASDQTRIVDRRSAKVGEAREDRVAVIEGLSPGEEVVSEGQSKLQPGMRVRADNRSALPPRLSPRPNE